MSSTPSKELLLLVPGAARLAHGRQRERLVTALTSAAEGLVLERVTDTGSSGVRLRVTSGSGERIIDVVETYWNDLMPSITQADARVKLARGLSLIIYWGFSGIWKGFFRRKFLTGGMIASGVALVTWYYGTVALFVQAVRYSEDAPAWLRQGATTVGQALDLVAGWEVWVLATAVMGVIPVTLLVEIMDFAKRFLANERVDDSGIGLRVQVRNRVLEQTRAALAADAYQRLIVVGHSFGCLVALDSVADLPLPPGLRLRLVTIGSSIELMSRRDPWPMQEARKCAARPELEAWVDIVADRDWLASGTPKPHGASAFKRTEAPSRGTIVDALTSRTHGMYFDTSEVVQAVLG